MQSSTRRAFSYAAPQIWNAISLNMLSSPAVGLFTRYLKALYFAAAFYRAIHYSAKRGLAIACRPSVCLSVCNVGGL